MTKNKERVLVYSDDPKDRKILDGSAERESKLNEQQSLVDSRSFVGVFRMEKSGRGGKTVVVLDQLPGYEPFLKELTKEFKIKCGVGGTFYIEGGRGSIEVQGDHRDKMKKILDARGIKHKGM
jgi:translation initiation factor 1